MTNRKFLYAHFNPKSGCDLHRLLYPLRWTGPEFPHLDFDLSVTDPFCPYHYYATHGSLPLNNCPFIGNWKRKGGRWLLSLDDAFELVPQWNPAKLSEPELDLLQLSYDLADAILVSTPALAAHLNLPAKTLTAPNLMQVADYGTQAPPADKGKLRILWAGSLTHHGDLNLIEKACDEILQKWGPERVEVICVGAMPQRLMKTWLNRGLLMESGVGMGSYPQLLRSLAPHVILAPLADIPFNLCKSSIRIYEGWSLAASVVTNGIGEYGVVRDGVDGLVVTGDDGWFEGIDRLLADRELREFIAVNGRQRVAVEFDWANPVCREPWRRVISELERRVQ